MTPLKYSVTVFLALMGSLLAGVFTVAAEIAPADAQDWKTYTNARFAYSVDVPLSGFEPLPPPDNGDGQAWASADGLVEVSAYGSHWSATSESFDDYETLRRSFILSDDAEITYKRVTNDWFVHSGHLKDGRIFYSKTVALPGCDIAAHIYLVYPETLKSVMDGIVARMARSLGPAVAVC